MERFGKLAAPALAAVALNFVAAVFAQAQVVSRSPTVAASPEPAQTSAAVQRLNLRVESIPAIELARHSAESGWVAPIVSVLSMLVALAAIIIGQKNNQASLWQKANETESKDIQGQLDEFYGPYLLKSEANYLMAQELRARQPEPERFRLLVKVFDRTWLDQLPAADRGIVREVCENAQELEGFIRDHAKMVDAQILPYLSRARAHFRILYLAHKGELGSEFPPYLARYVYPRSLDRVLKLEVDRLQRRCEALRASPHKAPGPLEPLVIPKELSLEEWPSLPRVGPETVVASMATATGGSKTEDGHKA